MRPALLLALVLWALPAVAADDSWSDADVEAAARFRDQERERADRYRAEVEATRSPAPAPHASPARSGAPEELGARVAGGLRAWLEGLLADLVRALADAIRAALREIFGLGEERHASPRHDLAPNDRNAFGAWLQRERTRADDWLDARPGPAAPDPDRSKEWEARDAERARELVKREEAEARERARRDATLERDARERARWQESWHDADAWRAEERARLEATGQGD